VTSIARRQTFGALFGAVLAIQINAQKGSSPSDDASEEVVEIGGDVSPPKLVHRVDPAHVVGSGTVVVGLIVTSRGLPRDVRIVESLSKEMDESAVNAVKQWRFDPARRKDKPVAVKVTVEIRFHDM